MYSLQFKYFNILSNHLIQFVSFSNTILLYELLLLFGHLVYKILISFLIIR